MHLVTFELATAPDADAEESTAPGRPRSSAGGFTDSVLGFESLDLLRPGARRLGAVMPPGRHGGRVVDLNRALAVKLATEDAGAPEAEADSLLPSDLKALLGGGRTTLAIAREAYGWAVESLERFDRPDLERGGVVLSPSRLRLHAPVPRPGKLIGVADNYPAAGRPRPAEPTLFCKASSSVIGTDDDIVLPAASDAIEAEGALAAVIGRRTRRVSVDAALDCVAGYTIANDVTARDFERARGQRFLAKSGDTFAPLGPRLVTRDEIGDPQKLLLTTRVSGEVWQSASTAEMLSPVAEVIAFASRLMTLEPGDIVLTGTPERVDAGGGSPRALTDGDFVEIEIEGIGCLRNHVRAERATRRAAR